MNISGIPGFKSLITAKPDASAIAGSGASVAGTRYDPDRLLLADAFVRAIELGDSLIELDRLLSTVQLTSKRQARAMSLSLLDLSQNELTATTLRSSQEVNATPTSFSPFGPDYDQPAGSTAEPTLDGVYDGSNGTGTLTFEARKDGVHGEDDLRFRVRDPGGNVIDDFQVRANDPIDQEYTLSNGLIFTLGAGTTEKKDTFTVEVYAAVGSAVDPDKPLDGVRNDNPNLEYGFSVTAGSFDINGTTIAVNAGDTLNDVLARIDASGADVSAVFDPVAEQVTLTRKSLGSAFDITLANDSTGFFQAMKLDTAVAEPGTDGNATTVMAELPLFAAVSSGVFSVNGVDISLDVTTDSLADVLERIEASSAAVTARLINDRVFIQSRSRTAALTLDEGTTGFFQSLDIRNGLYRPAAKTDITQSSAKEIAAAVAEAKTGLDGLFRNDFRVTVALASFRSEVSSTLAAVAADLAVDSKLQPGLTIDTAALLQSPLTGIDADQLVVSLQLDFEDMRTLFVGDQADARQGFVRELLTIVQQFTADLRGPLGTRGIRVDVLV